MDKRMLLFNDHITFNWTNSIHYLILLLGQYDPGSHKDTRGE